MRAVVYDEPGDENVLRTEEVPSPTLGPGEVRIRVAAAGVNRADLLQRRGLYPPPPGASEILGLECSGQVVELAADVNWPSIGDRVMALLTGGGYAEEVVAPASCVMAAPESLTDFEAGAVPEVFVTAFLNLVLLGGLTDSETVLIHGGSGGVGTAAIQLAREIGATVLVTAGTDARGARCLELGAAHAFNHRSQDFAAESLAATSGRGVDLVLDCIGAAYLDRHLDLLAPDGRLVVIGLQGGARADLDLAHLLRRRLTVIGSTLRSRSAADKGRIVAAFCERFGRALTERTIFPIIDRALPFDHASEAHCALAGGEVFGKLVLTPSPPE